MRACPLLQSKPARGAQRGFTLVSLMVSIVITLVGVLISLKVHTSHEASASELRASTAHNRQLLTALSVAQKEIQSAGFGIVNSNINDVATLLTPSTSTAPATNVLLWRYFDNGSFQCQGLRESQVTIDGDNFRSLDLITSAGCNQTSALTTLAWNGTGENLGVWKIDNLLTPWINANQTLFQFVVGTRLCTTSRIAVTTNKVFVDITVPDTARLNGNNLHPILYPLCLTNVT